ncbi:ABC-type antimicrobial peptide transport system, permease component [Chitinophaga eiseniae]|uniref:ABC-type antimicrobial peptide transport system, permease component n=1 Tax=Chitinophaga eiseniae TaxID=634771 RepID=A0A1T4RS55_9BACT|nr:ABC transporter permease [Chitinophaga eiseniae]SKA18666.1 ABC-type antimicrobial peptide transport system, permease component [Chitinophaga eiseniae]
MLRNYFLVAIRNIWRNKVFSLLNIMGLVTGISAALVVYLVVFYESGFNKAVADKDRIFRVVSTISFSGDSIKNNGVPVPVITVAKENVPQVEKAVDFFINNTTARITVEGKDFKNKEDVIFADKGYMDMLGYEWLGGDAATALSQPLSVVLTQERARVYFPNTPVAQVLGKQVLYDDSIRVTVTGVVKDLAYDTDFWFREMISLPTLQTNATLKEIYLGDNWQSISSSTQLLVKLRPAARPQDAIAILDKYISQHDTKDFTTELSLHPLSDLHFDTGFEAYRRTASRKQLDILSMIAVALLGLAVINFVNLTTAQASRRAKETGIRKAIGGTTGQLIKQFLGETMILTLLAAVLALLLAPLLIVSFHAFLPDDLPVAQLYTAPVLSFLFLLAAGVALIAGIYPAYVLSRFQPVVVLKSNTGHRGGKVWVRQTLTAVQFTVAQFFVIATLIVGKQINFSLNKDLGFRKNAILSVNTPRRDPDQSKRRQLEARVASLPEVDMVSLSANTPVISGTESTILKYNNGRQEVDKTVEVRYGDSNYLPLYQLRLLAGRNIATTDSVREWLLNEKAVAAFGFKRPQDAIGQVIEGHPVVGVVANFSAASVRSEIPAMAIGSEALKRHRVLHVRLRSPGEDGVVWKNAIAGIEKAWKDIYPREEFSYEFLDKTVANMYRQEQRMSNLLNWCAGLAIFISILGLLGLVIFTTDQRTKEIGIRKVLGATVWQVVRMLTTDFMKPVLVAFLLAIPLSWWVMSQWLQSFVYRTGLTWWVFAAGGVIMVLMALGAMSLKTVRAALSNPVHTLKTE